MLQALTALLHQPADTAGDGACPSIPLLQLARSSMGVLAMLLQVPPLPWTIMLALTDRMLPAVTCSQTAGLC